jgi:hypothetical protein
MISICEGLDDLSLLYYLCRVEWKCEIQKYFQFERCEKLGQVYWHFAIQIFMVSLFHFSVMSY